MPGISKTGIVNLMLIDAGEKTISNIETDTSPLAGKIRIVWDFARDYALSLHQWNFATCWIKNQAARGTNVSGKYSYSYTMPEQCIRVLQLGKNQTPLDVPWEGELDSASDTRVICTDLDPSIDIKYIKRVENTELYSPSFNVLLSKALKTFLARPISGKPEMKKEAEAELMSFIRNSLNVDGLEGTPEYYAPTDLEDVR